MDKTLNLANHFPAILRTKFIELFHPPYWPRANWKLAPSHTISSRPLSIIHLLTFGLPSTVFNFFFLSFDKGQWANAGKRLLKWGKLLSLRWYVQRKSPNFTDVGMVTMVRGTRVCSPFVEGEALGTETAYIPYIDCHFHIVIGHETKRAL